MSGVRGSKKSRPKPKATSLPIAPIVHSGQGGSWRDNTMARQDEIAKELENEYTSLYTEGIKTWWQLCEALKDHGLDVWLDEVDDGVRRRAIEMAQECGMPAMEALRKECYSELVDHVFKPDPTEWKHHLGRIVGLIRRGRSELPGAPLSTKRYEWRLQFARAQKDVLWPRFPHPLIRYIRYIHPYLGHDLPALPGKIRKWRRHMAVIAKRKAAPTRSALTIELEAEPGSPVFLARENEREEREIEKIISGREGLGTTSATEGMVGPMATPLDRPQHGLSGIGAKQHGKTDMTLEVKGPVVDIRWSWGQSWQ